LGKLKNGEIMNNVHPLTQYAKALIMATYDLTDESQISVQQIKEQIEIGLNHFRVAPSEIFEGKEKVKYDYSKIEKGNTECGIYLSPSIIAEDKGASKTFGAATEIMNILDTKNLNDQIDAKKNAAPLTGEYLTFNLNGGITRGKPKCCIYELGLNTISTITPYKPCLQDKGKNFAIIPNLSLAEFKDFILLFKDMLQHESSNDLKFGRVKKTVSGKKENEKIDYRPLRPRLFNGNFPNPPKSTSLGGMALLATIGEFAKQSEFSERALRVLDSLKDSPIYLIKYGDANSFTYSHHIIELSKSGKLRQIVDSIYYSKLYNQSHRDYNNTEYQKFDIFTSRFLQQFNSASLKDFLSFRAEYSHKIELLFNTYFTKMENIDSDIVKSARQLGKWLNLVAYIAAKAEIKEGSLNYWEKLREQKSKVLIELESAAFSAKSGDALIAQVITRAGRLSGMDVPPEADLFMEKAMSGELALGQAQNLIIAFSRLKNAKEAKEVKLPEDAEINENEAGSDENI
jgi:CRISPR-associated protein Cas8c/Csp2